MLPTIDEALKELKIAEELNPGPWVKHSINTGIAAKNIAEKVPEMDSKKAYIVGLLHDIVKKCKSIELFLLHFTLLCSGSHRFARFCPDFTPVFALASH